MRRTPRRGAPRTTAGGGCPGSRAAPRASRDVALEPVEPPFPHAIRLDPLPSLVEAFWAEPALPDPAYLLRRQQSRLLEDAHVFQDRGEGDPEGSCQLADRGRARGDDLQDAAAGRVGQRVERSVERRILRHLANHMQRHRVWSTRRVGGAGARSRPHGVGDAPRGTSMACRWPALTFDRVWMILAK